MEQKYLYIVLSNDKRIIGEDSIKATSDDFKYHIVDRTILAYAKKCCATHNVSEASIYLMLESEDEFGQIDKKTQQYKIKRQYELTQQYFVSYDKASKDGPLIVLADENQNNLLFDDKILINDNGKCKVKGSILGILNIRSLDKKQRLKFKAFASAITGLLLIIFHKITPENNSFIRTIEEIGLCGSITTLLANAVSIIAKLKNENNEKDINKEKTI